MADTWASPRPMLAHWGWQLTAACRGMGASVFFSPLDEPPEDRQVRLERAKAICQQCPAIQECRTFAIRTHEPYGVWGGMSEADRAKLLGVRNLRYTGERAARNQPTPALRNLVPTAQAAPVR